MTGSGVKVILQTSKKETKEGGAGTNGTDDKKPIDIRKTRERHYTWWRESENWASLLFLGVLYVGALLIIVTFLYYVLAILWGKVEYEGIEKATKIFKDDSPWAYLMYTIILPPIWVVVGNFMHRRGETGGVLKDLITGVDKTLGKDS